MIYTTILFLHIAAGTASFLIAPAYLFALSRNNRIVQKLRLSLKLSVLTTAILGIGMLFAGAPLGRTCATLAVYTAVMVGIISLSSARYRQIQNAV